MRAKRKSEASALQASALIKKEPATAPFLKWAGGKSQLLGELRKLVPAGYRRYVEPFLGGGALFFDLRPDEALLNDSNGELINAYEVVRDEPGALAELLSAYPNEKQFFYGMRARAVGDMSRLERAARFVYLNRTCFNGLHRVNKKNLFNVPFGSYSNPVICDADRLRAAGRALKRARLFCEDYHGFLLREARAGDFIYADPPYQPVSRYSDFKRYTQDFFYERDQARLAALLKELGERGCHVVASNSDCDFIRAHYAGWEIHKVQARRSINKDGSGRGNVPEVILVWPRR
jgi:DNA adenine methylase